MMSLMKKRDRLLVRKGSDCHAQVQEILKLEDVYSDISHLGTGRFSDVALVTHKESGQRVAIKMFSKDDVRYTDFIREYNYSVFLAPHPNTVITFEGLYSTPNFNYFVQEFCPTGSLREAVYETGGT
jgi:serine/threonine protein kinase